MNPPGWSTSFGVKVENPIPWDHRNAEQTPWVFGTFRRFFNGGMAKTHVRKALKFGGFSTEVFFKIVSFKGRLGCIPLKKGLKIKGVSQKGCVDRGTWKTIYPLNLWGSFKKKGPEKVLQTTIPGCGSPLTSWKITHDSIAKNSAWMVHLYMKYPVRKHSWRETCFFLASFSSCKL